MSIDASTYLTGYAGWTVSDDQSMIAAAQSGTTTATTDAVDEVQNILATSQNEQIQNTSSLIDLTAVNYATQLQTIQRQMELNHTENAINAYNKLVQEMVDTYANDDNEENDITASQARNILNMAYETVNGVDIMTTIEKETWTSGTVSFWNGFIPGTPCQDLSEEEALDLLNNGEISEETKKSMNKTETTASVFAGGVVGASVTAGGLALGSAKIGALIGSPLGLLGTAAGIAIGAGLGALVGWLCGKK